MEIKIPRGLVIFLSIVLLMGLGIFAGATGYRAGPFRAVSSQLAATQAELGTAKQTIASRDQRIAELEKRVAELDKSLQEARRAHQETSTRLSQTEAARRAAEQQARQQGQLLLTKERDIYVLRTCMVGVSASLGYVLDQDYDNAVYSLQSVERECRAATKLVE